MRGITGGFGSDADGESVGRYDRFDPALEPEPGSFLAGEDVLAGREHAATHRLACRLFERRGVYDVTFGYNLARLNLDPRHPDAGFRYARETDDPSGHRAEFTPTTEFCPQGDSLTAGAFRAWNGEAAAHGYDLVRVRVASMHHQAVAINGKLTQLEDTFVETGELRPDVAPTGCGDEVPDEAGYDAPF